MHPKAFARLFAAPPLSVPFRATLGAWALLGVSLLTLHPAQAADVTGQIEAMERQMRQMAAEIRELKKRQAIEHKKLQNELTRQRELLEANPYAPRDHLLANGSPVARLLHPLDRKALGTAENDMQGFSFGALAKPKTADTPFAQLTATPPVHPDLYGPLRRGQLQIGGARITLGGFVEAAGIWRQRDTGSDIATAFGAIPFKNSPYHHITEYRETSRAARLSVLVEGMIAKKIEADAYVETDFGGAGSSSNSRQSSSYTLRARTAYGELKDLQNGWYVLGGQSWSLLTLSNSGMFARNEQIPLTIDQQYVPGFVWTRTAQFRLVKMFSKDRYGIGLSVENPSANLQSGYCSGRLSNGTSVTDSACGTNITASRPGTSSNNPSTYYTTDIAPDIVAKATADPGWGHFEAYGVMRFFHDRAKYPATSGTPRSHTEVAGGAGGGMIVPVLPKKLYLQASGLVGTGIGRYGSAAFADYTFRPNGAPKPLPEASLLLGAYGNITPRLRLYSYAGMDTVRKREYASVTNATGTYHWGYGNPNYGMQGCRIEGSSSCAAGNNMNWTGEVTGGFWYTALTGDYGSILTGAQYAHIYSRAYSGMGGKPHTDENMLFFSLRYLPFS